MRRTRSWQPMLIAQSSANFTADQLQLVLDAVCKQEQHRVAMDLADQPRLGIPYVPDIQDQVGWRPSKRFTARMDTAYDRRVRESCVLELVQKLEGQPIAISLLAPQRLAQLVDMVRPHLTGKKYSMAEAAIALHLQLVLQFFSSRYVLPTVDQLYDALLGGRDLNPRFEQATDGEDWMYPDRGWGTQTPEDPGREAWDACFDTVGEAYHDDEVIYAPHVDQDAVAREAMPASGDFDADSLSWDTLNRTLQEDTDPREQLPEPQGILKPVEITLPIIYIFQYANGPVVIQLDKPDTIANLEKRCNGFAGVEAALHDEHMIAASGSAFCCMHNFNTNIRHYTFRLGDKIVKSLLPTVSGHAVHVLRDRWYPEQAVLNVNAVGTMPVLPQHRYMVSGPHPIVFILGAAPSAGKGLGIQGERGSRHTKLPVPIPSHKSCAYLGRFMDGTLVVICTGRKYTARSSDLLYAFQLLTHPSQPKKRSMAISDQVTPGTVVDVPGLFWKEGAPYEDSIFSFQCGEHTIYSLEGCIRGSTILVCATILYPHCMAYVEGVAVKPTDTHMLTKGRKLVVEFPALSLDRKLSVAETLRLAEELRASLPKTGRFSATIAADTALKGKQLPTGTTHQQVYIARFTDGPVVVTSVHALTYYQLYSLLNRLSPVGSAPLVIEREARDWRVPNGCVTNLTVPLDLSQSAFERTYVFVIGTEAFYSLDALLAGNTIQVLIDALYSEFVPLVAGQPVERTRLYPLAVKTLRVQLIPKIPDVDQKAASLVAEQAAVCSQTPVPPFNKFARHMPLHTAEEADKRGWVIVHLTEPKHHFVVRCRPMDQAGATAVLGTYINAADPFPEITRFPYFLTGCLKTEAEPVYTLYFKWGKQQYCFTTPHRFIQVPTFLELARRLLIIARKDTVEVWLVEGDQRTRIGIDSETMYMVAGCDPALTWFELVVIEGEGPDILEEEIVEKRVYPVESDPVEAAEPAVFKGVQATEELVPAESPIAGNFTAILAEAKRVAEANLKAIPVGRTSLNGLLVVMVRGDEACMACWHGRFQLAEIEWWEQLKLIEKLVELKAPLLPQSPLKVKGTLHSPLPYILLRNAHDPSKHYQIYTPHDGLTAENLCLIYQELTDVDAARCEIWQAEANRQVTKLAPDAIVTPSLSADRGAWVEVAILDTRLPVEPKPLPPVARVTATWEEINAMMRVPNQPAPAYRDDVPVPSLDMVAEGLAQLNEEREQEELSPVPTQQQIRDRQSQLILVDLPDLPGTCVFAVWRKTPVDRDMISEFYSLRLTAMREIGAGVPITQSIPALLDLPVRLIGKLLKDWTCILLAEAPSYTDLCIFMPYMGLTELDILSVHCTLVEDEVPRQLVQVENGKEWRVTTAVPGKHYAIRKATAHGTPNPA